MVTNLTAQNIPSLYSEIEQAYSTGNHVACIKLERSVLSLAAERKDTLVANAFFYLGDAYLKIGKMQKAIEYFEREKNLRTLLQLTHTEEFSNSLSNLVFLYFETGNYLESERLLNQLLANDKSVYGISSSTYTQTILFAAETLVRTDQSEKAQKLVEVTLAQQPKDSETYGLLLYKLGDIFTYRGNYSLAEKALISAVNLLEKTFGKNSQEYLGALVTLGGLLSEQGRFAEAEEILDTALALLNPSEELYISTLNQQAFVYRSLGQFERAEKAFLEIKTHDSTTLGVFHPDYAITLSNLGLAQSDLAKFTEAEQTFMEALAIQKKNKESATISFARKQTNLARLYQLAEQATKALPLLESASATFKNKLGKKSPEYATAMHNLGLANWKAGRGDLGFKQLQQAAKIRELVLGKYHPRYAESLEKIAEYQWSINQKKEARQSFKNVFDAYYFQLNAYFPVLTEEEKASFYYSKIRPSFDKFNAFAFTLFSIEPSVLGELYDHQLNTKSVIMLATEKVKQGIQQLNDPVLNKQYEEWIALKESIARLVSQNQEPWRIDSIQLRAAQLEKDITRKSADFSSQYMKKKYTWQDIRKKLQPGEAAIEVIRFNDYIPLAGGKFNNEIKYAFLVITTESENHPDLLIVENGNNMEGKALNFYRNSVKFQQKDPFSYKTYFEILGDYLQKNKIQKIYFSPEGVYNQLNLNGMLNPFSSKYLIDELVIELLSTTKELAEPGIDKRIGLAPTLLGYPSFNLKEQGIETVASTRGALRGGSSTRGFRGGLLRYMNGENGISQLPGTQKEIAEIAKLFGDGTKLFMEAAASEKEIKNLKNPTILHIATHGYFLENSVDVASSTSYAGNPLLNSGLILAGAENFLTSGIPLNDTGDDGILTAYEAMNLRLDSTDLVVLSACETGLGKIKNGDGVYGLQRAFKLAGAHCIVMSLWNVDDEATEKLMTLLYEQLTQGKTPALAFRSAQLRLKEIYTQPFYWASFVMTGH